MRLKEDYNERAGRTQSYITDRIWPLGELVEIDGLIYAEYFDAVNVNDFEQSRKVIGTSMKSSIEEFISVIPEHLLNVSGVVPYSGREAFIKPQAPVYFLSLNPGGKPRGTPDGEETYQGSVHETIGESIKRAWGPGTPPLMSNYLDISWSGHAPGTKPFQRRMRHLFEGLGFNLRLIPASNLIFPRSRRKATLEIDFHKTVEECWPFHQTVIDRLGIKTIIAAGSDVGINVRKKLGANSEIAVWEEANDRRWKFRAHENGEGIRVLTLTHPSIADWTTKETDPTEFVQTFMAA